MIQPWVCYNTEAYFWVLYDSDPPEIDGVKWAKPLRLVNSDAWVTGIVTPKFTGTVSIDGLTLSKMNLNMPGPTIMFEQQPERFEAATDTPATVGTGWDDLDWSV